MKDLTERQEAILTFIRKFLATKGYPPTIREIGEHFGIASTNGVNDHLVALEKKGYLSRNKVKSRALEVLKNPAGTAQPDPGRVVSIPVVGQIAAGTPILADQNIEDHLALDERFVKTNKNIFSVKVKGNSMLGDGILDGDYVILQEEKNNNPQDIFAVLLDDEVTLKRVKVQADKVELIPSNPNMRNIVINKSDEKQLSIIGKMVGLVRVS